MCPSQSITSASVVIAWSSLWLRSPARIGIRRPKKTGSADAGIGLAAEQLDDGRDDVEGRTNAVVAGRESRGGDVGPSVAAGGTRGPWQGDGAAWTQP